MLTDMIFASVLGVGLMMFLSLWVAVRPAGGREDGREYQPDIRVHPK